MEVALAVMGFIVSFIALMMTLNTIEKSTIVNIHLIKYLYAIRNDIFMVLDTFDTDDDGVVHGEKAAEDHIKRYNISVREQKFINELIDRIK